MSNSNTSTPKATSNSGSSSSSSSSKKENFVQSLSGAGELAVNLFDILKKKHLNASSSSPSPSSLSTIATAQQSNSSTQANTASLLSNLAISFHKSLSKSQESAAKEEHAKIVLKDDESIKEAEVEEEKPNESWLSIKEREESENSLSDLSLNASLNSSQSKLANSATKNTNIKQSSSFYDPNMSSTNASSSTSSSTSKLVSSASLQKITSLFDDILKSDLANHVVDTASLEAQHLRKRFLTKKKSIDETVRGKLATSKERDSSQLQMSTQSGEEETQKQAEEGEEIQAQTAQVLKSTPNEQSNEQLVTDEGEEAKTEPSLVIDESQQPQQQQQDNGTKSNETSTHQNGSESPSNDTNNSECVTTTKSTNKSSNKGSLSLYYFIGLLFILPFAILLPFKFSFSFFIFICLFVFLCGILFAMLVLYFMIKLDFLKHVLRMFQNGDDVQTDDQENTAQLKSLLVSDVHYKENKNFDGIYKGWMNELSEKYEPEHYFLNKTRSVYLNLDGCMLRLQTTNVRVPKRVCSSSEQISACSFNEQRMYDLSNCDVSLLPQGLVRKRFWSKKYPVCLKGVKLLSTKIATCLNTNNNGNNQNEREQEQDEESGQLDRNTLILFARTDREKEEWFRLFKKSSCKRLLDSSHYLKQNSHKSFVRSPTTNSIQLNTTTPVSKLSKSSSIDSSFTYDTTSDKIVFKTGEESQSNKASKNNDSSRSQAPSTSTDQSASISNNNKNNNEVETQTENALVYDSSLTFMNTFLIRIFADFFTQKQWIQQIQNKIQNKLKKVNVPYFMEELQITGLDLGSVIPLIKHASDPWYDEKGLWVHLDLDYSGGLQMSLATKLNLMKLKSSNSSGVSTPNGNNMPKFSFNKRGNSDEEASIAMIHSEESKDQEQLKTAHSQSDKKEIKRKKNLAIYDSNEEDSPESSGDEYVHTGFNDEDNKLIETANSSRKLLNIVNKIVASNYFQKATENKLIKKAMENVSNCQLLLNVEVKRITGTLALNIPEHPSDRLWFGFVTNPQLVLCATPQVGDKELAYSAISDFIAEKLKLEFQKVLVFPNMDDLYIPILNSEIDFKNW